MKLDRIQQRIFKRTQLSCGLGLSLFFIMFSGSVCAANDWGNYRSVERYASAPSGYHSNQRYPNQSYGYSSYKGYADPYGTPLPAQQYPIRPPVNHKPYPPHGHYPNGGSYPNRPSYPVYPQQNGVTIIYNHQFPQQTEYQSQSYGYVNGANGRIESSTYTLISDWRRYGLPDPQVGMHWIFQNGRYIQIANDR